MRFLVSLLIVGVLAACNAGASSPTENPLPTLEPTGSGMTDMSEEPSESASAEVSMTCEEAFDELASSEVSSVTDLASLTDELDDTIAACDTLDEWRAAAEDALPDLDLSDVESFIGARCDEASDLSDTAICDELSS